CEVTIGDDGPDALGQRHRGNVDGIADFPACQINGDGIRDRIGRAIELDFVAHDVEHTTALDAGRLVLVDEADRDVDVNFRILAHPQEVHVQREILDRIELVVLRQDPDLLSVHVDRGNRGQKAAAVNLVVDVLVGQGDGQGRLLGAVDDGRYLALTANCTGGPLTDLFASLGLELISIVAHGVSFRVVERSRRAQALSVNVESRHLFAWPSPNPMSLPGNAEPAALGRVASKGVYADGGSIADAGRWRKA